MRRISVEKVLKGFLLPAMALILWQWMSHRGLLNSYIIPPPSKVIFTAKILIQRGVLAKHVVVSLCRVMAGFLVALGMAFPLAVIVGLAPPLGEYLKPALEFIRHIPPIAIIPMLILWLGIGEAPKIAVIILASFFPIFLNTLSGIAGCDPGLLEVGDSFGFTSLEKIARILLPAALPSVMVGMRLGLGYSWRALMGAELIAASSGMGYMIMDAEQLSRPDIILVGILTLGALGCALDYAFFAITRVKFSKRRCEGAGD